MKFSIFLSLTAVLCAASVSAQADIFGSIFKAAADMVTQTMNMGMGIVKASMDLMPFDAAIKMAEQSIQMAMQSATAAKDLPEKMLSIFHQGASVATKAAGGVVNPSAMLFQQAADQVTKLQGAEANPADYMNLMKKMQEAIA